MVSAMRSQVIVLVLLVILGTLKADLSSAEVEVKNDLRELLLEEDIVYGQFRDDSDFDRKKKPGRKPGKKPGKKPNMRPFRSFRSTALSVYDSEIANLTCSNLANFQKSQEDCSISRWLKCLMFGYKSWVKCKKPCKDDKECRLSCVEKKIDQNPNCIKCNKQLLMSIRCHYIGGQCHINTSQGETEDSVLIIIENGQEVKQEISFNNYTGILTIDVPPHISAAQENFTQATTTFDVKTNANVIKTNNSCVLSDIPDYINAAAMPEYFQQVKEGTATWDNSNKTVVYDVKMVESVVSPEDRKELTSALDSLCNNEVIKKAENTQISEDNYGKLMNDEIIFMDDGSENKRTGCSTKKSCTSNGPASCGNYGWYNPVLMYYITMHQVSANSVCLKCCIKSSPSCNCEEQFPELYPCVDITTKEIFMDALLAGTNGTGEYDVPIQDSDVNARATTTQLLTYNSKNDARSVKIHVPSHGDVAETTLLMHAHTSGYWHYNGALNNNMMVKVGSTCYVKTLPHNIFPVDVALGIKHINAGGVTLKPEYEKNKYMAIRTENIPLTDNEKQNLNPEIYEICKNNAIIKYEEIDLDETEFQTLNDGEVIDLKIDQETRSCVFKTLGISNQNPRGCWRFSNPDAGIEIGVHHQASETLEVKCCKDLPGNPNCCIDSGYCECKDITDWTTFQRCRTPIKSEIGDGSSCQTDEYDRNTGDLIVETKSCNDSTRSIQSSSLEEATVGLYESQDLQLLKKGNSCYVLPLGERDPTKIAQDTAEIAKKINGQITSDMEKVSTSVIVPRPGLIPALPEDADYCDGINLTLADEVPVEETQFQDLQDGKIITLPQSLNIIEEGKCLFETKCASNSGSSGFWWPIAITETPYFVHELMATPTCLLCCLEGMDPEYCECSQINDMETFQKCIPIQEMVMVITGAHGETEYNLVNRFIRNQSSPGLQLEALPVSPSSNFPVETSFGVGVWIDDRLIACQGTGGVDDGCYEMHFGNKSWTQGYNFQFLVDPLIWGGASAKYKSGPTGNEAGETWWIIGGDPKGNRTQEWNSAAGTNPWAPPVLPLEINTPCCMTAISDREVFVAGYPMDVPADSNMAWIFSWDYTENDGWKALPSLREERYGAACGFIPNNGSGWVVVAGGYEKSSSEYLDLSKCLDPESEECAWKSGPELGGDFYGASIVRMSTDELVLFGDHSDILAIDSTFTNWEVVGQISQPRYSAVVLAIN